MTTYLAPGRAQVARDLAADAAEAADDVVVGQGVDHPLRPALVEQLREVPGDEELGDRHQGVEERTDAEHDQDDLDDLPADVGRRPGSSRRWRRCRAPRRSRPTAMVPSVHGESPTVPTTSSPAISANERARRRRGEAGGARGSPASVVVGLAGEDLVAAVELLEQHDARELVRQRHRPEREPVVDARRARGPNGPPMTKHRSRPSWRRSSRKRAERHRSRISLAVAVQQRDERALGDPARDLLVLAHLDQLEPRVAGEQLAGSAGRRPRTAAAAARRPGR